MTNSDGNKQKLRKTGKTQKALAGSLLSLLHKHSLQKITVNDICETAMVSRASFYVHFEDKYHLLRFALENISPRMALVPNGLNKQDLIRAVVDYVYENMNLFKNLFLKETNPELTKMLSEIFVHNISEQLEKHPQLKENSPIPIPVLSVFMAGGIVHLFLWWIGGGFSISKEEMIKYLTIMSPAEPCLPYPDFVPSP